jgi:hypothetical protein
VNVVACLCAHLLEHDSVVFSQRFRLAFLDRSLLFQIALVTQNGHDATLSPLIFDVIDPFL